MESYRHEIEENDKYCAVIFVNNKNGKLGLCYNIHDENFIRDYWKNNEEPFYSIVEVKPITNVTALKYFQYWMLIPKAYKTEDQRNKKFDFYKYVVGADLSLKYRGKEFIGEIGEVQEDTFVAKVKEYKINR